MFGLSVSLQARPAMTVHTRAFVQNGARWAYIELGDHDLTLSAADENLDHLERVAQAILATVAEARALAAPKPYDWSQPVVVSVREQVS